MASKRDDQDRSPVRPVIGNHEPPGPRQPVAHAGEDARMQRLHHIAGKARRDPRSLTIAELEELCSIVAAAPKV